MFKKFILGFAVLAMAAASAATYTITLTRPSVVKGTELKAGQYRLSLGDSKVTIAGEKQSIEVPVKVENGDTKFDHTAFRYEAQGDKSTISEIRLGGTKTKLVLNP